MEAENTLLSLDSKRTALQNILFQEEFSALAQACAEAKISLTAIKGISFLGRLYNYAERSMTDIDIFISVNDLAAVRKMLLSNGYLERIEDKWEFNHYKTLFVKYHMGLEIVFEVHTQLHSDKSKDAWKTLTHNNYQILSPTDELVYLAYHYAHQHTLLHPKWLHDLYLLSRSHADLWSKEAWAIAKEKELYSALMVTAYALNCKYQMNITIPRSSKSIFFTRLINLDFIDHSEKFPTKYYVAKHLIKDNLFKAISYDFKWLYFNLKKLFLK